MAETRGSLTDKLSIVNIKMFMVQDKVHAAAANGEGLDAETVQNLVTLNLQRTALINEIDALDGETHRIVKILDAQGAKS